MNRKILKFTASWCGPCKALGPEIDKIRGEINIEDIDIETVDGRQLATDMGVRALPSLFLMEGEKPLGVKTGLISADELREWVNT